MKLLTALAIGYVLGAKAGGEDLDRFGRSVKALCATEEFGDVVSAARSQLASSLRGRATVVEGSPQLPETTDLVAHVRRLVGQP